MRLGAHMHRTLPPFMLGVGVTLVVCIVLSWGGLVVGGFSLLTTHVEVLGMSDTENSVEGTGIPVKITDLPADSLTKDAIFMGFMTFCGD